MKVHFRRKTEYGILLALGLLILATVFLPNSALGDSAPAKSNIYESAIPAQESIYANKMNASIGFKFSSNLIIDTIDAERCYELTLSSSKMDNRKEFEISHRGLKDAFINSVQIVERFRPDKDKMEAFKKRMHMYGQEAERYKMLVLKTFPEMAEKDGWIRCIIDLEHGQQIKLVGNDGVTRAKFCKNNEPQFIDVSVDHGECHLYSENPVLGSEDGCVRFARLEDLRMRISRSYSIDGLNGKENILLNQNEEVIYAVREWYRGKPLVFYGPPKITREDLCQDPPGFPHIKEGDLKP